jgi:hypothetical protein
MLHANDRFTTHVLSGQIAFEAAAGWYGLRDVQSGRTTSGAAGLWIKSGVAGLRPMQLGLVRSIQLYVRVRAVCAPDGRFPSFEFDEGAVQRVSVLCVHAACVHGEVGEKQNRAAQRG